MNGFVTNFGSSKVRMSVFGVLNCNVIKSVVNLQIETTPEYTSIYNVSKKEILLPSTSLSVYQYVHLQNLYKFTLTIIPYYNYNDKIKKCILLGSIILGHSFPNINKGEFQSFNR